MPEVNAYGSIVVAVCDGCGHELRSQPQDREHTITTLVEWECPDCHGSFVAEQGGAA